MTLTEEEVRDLKAQLTTQIQHLSPEQRQQAQQQIDRMSAEALETMLRQQQERAGSQKTIFRLLVDKEIETVQLDYNNDAIAVLDINPLSKGHTLIIPRQPVKEVTDLPSTAFDLAKSLAKKIQANLKCSSVEIQTEKKFNEAIIHIIPIYDKPLTLQSQRQKSSLEELKKVEQEINPPEKPKPITIKQSSKPEGPPLKLPRRIP